MRMSDEFLEDEKRLENIRVTTDREIRKDEILMEMKRLESQNPEIIKLKNLLIEYLMVDRIEWPKKEDS